MNAETTILLIAGIMALNVAALAGVLILLKRQLRQQAASLQTRLEQKGVTLQKGPASANYRGQANDTIPLKGNGLITLTDRDLRVTRIMPSNEYIVPLAEITSVRKQTTWKSSYRAKMPVLVVDYGRDELGVSIVNIDEWGHAIAEAAGVLYEV